MNNAIERKRSCVRGSALLLAVVLLAIMSLGAGVAWSRLSADTDRQFRAELEERAWHTAEAGLETAAAQLRAQGENYRGEENTPFDAGSFTVRVEPEGAGTYRLYAVGTVHDKRVVFAERRLEATLDISPAGHIVKYRMREKKP